MNFKIHCNKTQILKIYRKNVPTPDENLNQVSSLGHSHQRKMKKLQERINKGAGRSFKFSVHIISLGNENHCSLAHVRIKMVPKENCSLIILLRIL